jgi:hypothetical protein
LVLHGFTTSAVLNPFSVLLLLLLQRQRHLYLVPVVQPLEQQAQEAACLVAPARRLLARPLLPVLLERQARLPLAHQVNGNTMERNRVGTAELCVGCVSSGNSAASAAPLTLLLLPTLVL